MRTMGSDYSKNTLERDITDLELNGELETAAEEWSAMRTLTSVVETWFEVAGRLV